MKKVFISLLLSVFFITSCSNHNTKNLYDMSLIELNDYYSTLKKENNTLNDRYNHLLDSSGNKTTNEIIDLINYVNQEIIKSNVMITNETRSSFLTSSISSGSGTIIKEDNQYYYVLTNNHVIYSLGHRSSYYIYDYLNNEYNATLLFNDSNYDMALLRFNKKSTNLKVISLANEDPKVNDNIIAIGQPKGQRNAITFGEVLFYGKVNCNNCAVDESNINYDCVFYNAITTHGNSGGMVIDYNYNLVGVVTYGMNNSLGEYMYGAGSPVSKVREFFTNNEFKVGDNYE